MDLPNGQQRRKWAKQTGMIKKKQKASRAEQIEMTTRAIEIGRQIHRANTERVLRDEEARQNKLKAKQMEELMESGLSQEEALKIINKFDE